MKKIMVLMLLFFGLLALSNAVFACEIDDANGTHEMDISDHHGGSGMDGMTGATGNVVLTVNSAVVGFWVIQIAIIAALIFVIYKLNKIENKMVKRK